MLFCLIDAGMKGQEIGVEVSGSIGMSEGSLNMLSE